MVPVLAIRFLHSQLIYRCIYTLLLVMEQCCATGKEKG